MLSTSGLFVRFALAAAFLSFTLASSTTLTYLEFTLTNNIETDLVPYENSFTGLSTSPTKLNCSLSVALTAGEFCVVYDSVALPSPEKIGFEERFIFDLYDGSYILHFSVEQGTTVPPDEPVVKVVTYDESYSPYPTKQVVAKTDYQHEANSNGQTSLISVTLTLGEV